MILTGPRKNSLELIELSSINKVLPNEAQTLSQLKNHILKKFKSAKKLREGGGGREILCGAI